MRFAVAVLLCWSLAAPAQEPTEVTLTVYSAASAIGFDAAGYLRRDQGRSRYYYSNNENPIPGYGVVKEVREVDLKRGANTVSLVDVAQFLDPTTVSFSDLSEPETAVLEQQYLYDLLSDYALLNRYVDREITVLVPQLDGGQERITGTLLSASGSGLVLLTKQGTRIVPRQNAQFLLGELPGGLVTRPTLQWLVDSPRAGKHRVRTTYETAGLTWRADFNLVLDAAETQADLSAWVTLLNVSGATYRDARLKLIAGDPQRVVLRNLPRGAAGAPGPSGITMGGGFEEKTFFEYHLYTLPRPTTIEDYSAQQLTLFPTASGIEVKKEYVYYGADWARGVLYSSPNMNRDVRQQSNSQVDIYVGFDNTKANRLGMPLPRGLVRLYKLDPDDGALEFIGEDLIDHTPRDERVLTKVGKAFDLVGERVQTDFQREGDRVILETFKVQVRNHKDEAVKVMIREPLYRWSNWSIVQQSDPFEKVDYRTIHFPVDVPAHGEKTITYTVKYSW